MIHLEPREKLDDAIIGKDKETGRIIYCREKLIEIYSQEYQEQNPEISNKDSYHIAADHVSYNIEGTGQNYSDWPIIQDTEE